jgi:hypothetical protein
VLLKHGKKVYHEEHEVHEERQCCETSFPFRVIADDCGIRLSFFVFFVRFVVCSEVSRVI